MKYLIRILCILAGTIWLITSLYVVSNPALNRSLQARQPDDASRRKLLLRQLQSLKDTHAPLANVCLQYRLLAADYFAANDYETAENTLLNCLEYLKASKESQSHADIYCMTYNLMADFWLARSDFQNSEILYQKAKGFCSKGSLMMAKTTNNLAVLYYLWGEATSDPLGRKKKLSQSRNEFVAALAQLKATREYLDKEHLEFVHKFFTSNYQNCLSELAYSDQKIASLR